MQLIAASLISFLHIVLGEIPPESIKTIRLMRRAISEDVARILFVKRYISKFRCFVPRESEICR